MHHPNDDRPGFALIDRYMPNASDEKREEAYRNFMRLVAILLRINERIAREEMERDSQNIGV